MRSRMREFLSDLDASRKALPKRHKAWVRAKLLVALWVLLYAWLTPAATAAVLGAFIWTVAVATVIGIIMSIVGMWVAMHPLRTNIGLRIETSGLMLALAGPAVHAVTMVSLTIGQILDPVEGVDTWGRVGPFMQSVSLAAFLLVRRVEVRSRITAGGA